MRFLLVLICFQLSFWLHAQSFAPVGATWDYTLHDMWWVRPAVVKSIKDTLFMGKHCKVLKGVGGACNYVPRDTNGYYQFNSRIPPKTIVYDQDSVVYFWEWNFNRFEILYDFSADKDSTWVTHYFDYEGKPENASQIVHYRVDSVGTTIINSVKLKTQHVSSSNDSSFSHVFGRSKIIYNIGSEAFLFNRMHISIGTCDGSVAHGLRCYSDTSLGFYSSGIASSCDFDNTSVSENELDGNLSVYPNPASSVLYISIKNTPYSYSYSLLNIKGEKLMTGQLESETHLDVSELSRGIYFLQLSSEDTSIVRRVVLQ